MPANTSTSKPATPTPAKKRGRPVGSKTTTPKPKVDETTPSIKIANELEEEGKRLLAAAAVLRERNVGKATK